ncbi:MAG TPA: hypothetical protein PKN75_06970, partial [Bacteroidia bacterium]|nr:hypothetical protein [Bacteroidia bacterium]HNU33317.1 hypothetical protein [Bacteroidia bacterium]
MNKIKQFQKAFINRWLFSMAVLIGTFGCTGYSQTAQIGTGTLSPPATLYGPLYRFSSTSTTTGARVNILYTAAEMAAAGIPAGAQITSVQFNKTTTSNFTSDITSFSMYAANTSNTSLATTLTWASVLGTHTNVFTAAPYNLPNTAGWVTWTFSSPFTYTGGALEIATEHTKGSAGSTAHIPWEYTDLLANQIVGVASATGTTLNGTVTAYKQRPNIRINYISAGCTAPPTPGLSTALPSSGLCVGNNIALGLSGNSSGSGQSYQWQESTLIGGPYTNLGSSSSGPSLNTPATSTKYYRCEVTCSGNSQNSTPVLVSVNPPFPGGNYTINSGAITGGTNFQTFNDFKNALTCGIGGAIVVDVVSGSGPYNEQVEFPAVTGVSSTNTITINGNNNTLTFAASVSTAPGTLILNGSDYFVINNLNVTGTGTTYALSCHLWNGADNNTFNNCTFTAPTGVTVSTVSPFSISGSATSATTTGTGGSNNTASNCNTSGGYYGLTFVSGSNNQSLNCNVREFYLYGLYNASQIGSINRECVIERPTRTDLSTFYGIYLSSCTNHLAERNRIRKSFSGNTASTSTAYGIYITGDASVGNENKFINNLITEMNGNGILYGIYSTGADYWQAWHNTISLDHTAATTTSTTNGIYSSGTLAYDVRNNNITITRGGAGTNKHCLYFTTAAVATCNYNNLYISAPGTINVGYNGTSYATLGAWQGASGYDANSLSVDPIYAAPGAEDYSPTSGAMNDLALNLGVAVDIENTSRSATPDIGAYEFSPPSSDAAISWVAPLPPVSAGLQTITVNIFNNTANTITDLNLSYTDGGTPVTEAFSGLNIAGLTSQQISFTVQYNLTGTTSLEAYINTVNGAQDANQNNDTTATQNLCLALAGGTYTINSGLPTGGTNYQTFNAAVAAMACGITGPVVFNVNATSGPYSEQVTITPVAGSSAINTITINGNGRTLTFAGTASLPYTLGLNGADFITVNNLIVTGTDGTNGLTVHLWNQADNNNFNGCTFNASQGGTGTLLCPFSVSGSVNSATLAGISGNNIVVSGCTLIGGYYGLALTGVSAAVPATGNQVLGCTVQDFYLYGIYNANQNGVINRNNITERPLRVTVSTHYGIYLTSCSNALIEKNRVRKAFDGAITSTSSGYGIYLTGDASAGNENKITNNLISDFRSNGINAGIYSVGSDYLQVYHNTVSFEYTASTATALTYGLYSTGTLQGDFQNNIVSISRGGTGTKYCVYYSTPAAITSNYNNLYINAAAGTNNVGYNGTGYTTLTAWQSASGKDGASQSVNPGYINPSIGNYKPTAVAIDNIGFPLGITNDITNATRSLVTPDPGAYEFAVSPYDVGAEALITPDGDGCYTFGETITVSIRNYGTQAIDFSVNPVTVTCNITGAITTTVSTTLTTGTLASGTVTNVALSPNVNMSPNGVYTFNASTSMGVDGDNSNDAMLPDTRTVGVVAGSISTSATDVCVSGSRTITLTGNYGGDIFWQVSTVSATGPWTLVQTGGQSYTATISQNSYYQVEVVCNGNTAQTNVITFNVNNPQILTTAPGTRCGFGTVTLGATADGSNNVNWYNSLISTTPLATGNTYTTPAINSTTTYYAEPASGTGGTGDLSVPITGTTTPVYHHMYLVNSSTGMTLTGLGLNVNNTVGTLTDWDIYYRPDNYQLVSGANTSSAGWTLLTSVTGVSSLGAGNYTVLSSSLNLTIPAGATYSFYIAPVGTSTHAYRTDAIGTTTATNAVASIIAGNRGSSLFNCSSSGGQAVVKLFYSLGCAGVRVPVTATVTPPPSMNIVPTDVTLCPGGTTSIIVNSSNDPDYTYSWTSNPVGFTATGAGPHSISPTVSTWYIVTATDNTAGPNAGCVNRDSVQVITGTSLSGGTVSASQTTFCQSGAPTLSVTGADGGAFQWQSSTTSASGPWSNVGTGSTVYAPGTITQTTWYQLRVSCQSTQVFSNVLEVIVNNPQITSSNGATRCGPGPVTLQATGSGGSTLNWYSASTGGSSLGSGASYSPTVNATTTFYVGASVGGGGTTTATMPAQSTTFTGNVRGYWFTAPSSFTITSVNVPLTGTTQSIAIVKFTGAVPPPVFSATTNAFTTEFLVQNSTNTSSIPCNVTVNAGDVIGILGQRGNITSYGPSTNPVNVTIAGSSVPLNRMIMQLPLGANAPQNLSWEASATTPIGRIEFEYTTDCESSRVPVVATVTPSPTVNIAVEYPTICTGQSATLTATSTNPGYTYTWTPGGSGASITVSPSSTTTYNLEALDISGGIYDQCTAVGSTTVTAVNQLPPTPVVQGGNPTETVCEGLPLTLSANNAAGGQTTTYSWTTTASLPFTSSQQTPTVTSSAATGNAGLYTVVLTNQYLCTASGSVTAIVNANPTLGGTVTNVSCWGTSNICD